jgi:uncharacterized membrane protein
MTAAAHLWAIGYDNMEQAEKVRDEITGLGWSSGQGGKYMILLDIAVVVRHPDGSFRVNRTPFQGITNILACTAAGFLGGLVVAAPLSGATIGALVGGIGSATVEHFAIEEDFIRAVEKMMKPGTSALFVLDEAGDMDVILHTIQGLGGTVVKTNVELERAKLIQATLVAKMSEK